MSIVAGVSGYKRNAAVALSRDGRLLAACEEGRVTRVRDVGLRAAGFPHAALAAALDAVGARPEELSHLVVAEPDAMHCSDSRPLQELDHHFAHAAASYLTSPFGEALMLVCDTSGQPEVSAWIGRAAGIRPLELEWQGAGFASMYSRLTGLLGLTPGTDEYEVEALARAAAGAQRLLGIGERLQLTEDGLRVDGRFDDDVRTAASGGLEPRAEVAAVVQQRIGELLVSFLDMLRSRSGVTDVCLGGGLFYNTYLNTVVRRAGIFSRVHVPVNPGNAGLAAGCALAGGSPSARDAAEVVSPFLGPGFTNEAIKAVLDNCKLDYEFLDEGPLVDRAVDMLVRGGLVGWFSGRMEWGPRALGNRSILANPLAPYVLENLNRFLKHRPPHRTYGLSVPLEDAGRFFVGPVLAPYMECEFELVEPRTFPHLVPSGATRLRVQTVTDDPPLFRPLLKRFEEAAGVPVLVNTSFNGFHEPIVCSPRDAIRVFYGTGLDLLVIGNFVLTK